MNKLKHIALDADYLIFEITEGKVTSNSMFVLQELLLQELFILEILERL